MLENLRIVLVNTTHPGNIGAAARAMKNMGLSRLYLVDPARFPDPDASARASGADDLLSQAVVCKDLDEALVGCRLVYGTSARQRSVQWPEVDPAGLAAECVDELAAGEVAVVFGRERSGLTNGELDRCHRLVHIPCNPDFSSLNLGASVQVISYELRKQVVGATPGRAEAREAVGRDVMEGLYQHMQQTLTDLEFVRGDNPEPLMRQVRRLYDRARPDQNEINILRGMLSAAQGRKSMRR